MKKIFLISIISFIVLTLNAQIQQISDSAEYSLITCSPGEQAYEKFGHTAIRINDPASGTDIVFNYGMFSFQTEHFYYKFIKGETDYQLAVYETKYFLPEYKERNSVVWEQILNLSVIEKRVLLKELTTNYQPENRTYRYNFIFDNCATRPRERILSSLNSYITFNSHNDSRTFRQWVGVYVGNDTWLKFGIDLVFGLDADKMTTTSESEFLPENLMTEFQTATLTTKDNRVIPLIKEKKVLIERVSHTEATGYPSPKPLIISILIFMIGTLITVVDYCKKHTNKFFNFLLLFITGLGGIVVLYLMLVSTHPLVKNNLNILWLNPLNFFIAFLLWFRRARITLFFYQIFNMALLLIALLAFALSAQDINIAFFPIIVLLLMRSACWFVITKHKIYKRGRSKP